VRVGPYPRYKPSGIDWLGEVPEGWNIMRLSYLTACLDGRRIPLNGEERSYRQGEYPYWGANGVLDHIDSWLFDEPLVLLGEDGAPFFDPYKEVAFYVTGKIWVNNHAHVLRVSADADARFLVHVLNCTAYGVFIDGSTRDKLTQSDMNAIPIPCPSLSEQRAIAHFLDATTTKLDTLVVKKRALIERLKEKRTALISRTVTRGLPPDVARAAGLNPHPKLKPSGIEWLGEVPVNWDVTRLKNVIKGGLANGLFKTKEYFGSGTRLINVYDAYRKEFLVDEQSLERVEATPSELNAYRVQSGDIFFVRSSLKVEGVGRAVCCLSPAEDLVFECHLVRARPRLERITPVFLITFLNSCFGIHWLISQANTVTMATLGQTKIMDLPVLVPPRVEQGAIADYLDRETVKIDRMVEKVEAAIERLQEYRTALITAAVTGKIDVRSERADNKAVSFLSRR
jgi:type I restriction enzyme S subunit